MDNILPHRIAAIYVNDESGRDSRRAVQREDVCEDKRKRYVYAVDWSGIMATLSTSTFLRASRAGDAALDLGGVALRAESTGVLH